MATTSTFSSQLNTPDLRRVFVEVGKERPLEYPEWMNVDTMEWQGVKDFQVSGMGTAPVKPEGTQFVLDQPITGGTKTYTAEPSGKAFEVTWEGWRDELYGVFREMAAEAARSLRHRQEVQAASVLNNAFSTSFTGFTASEALVSTTHTRLDGGSSATTANRPSPDIGLSVTGLQAAITRYESMVDERGLPRLMTPTMLLVGPANKFVAREILMSGGKPYSADNEINALIEEDLSWMISHYFTLSTQWFLLAAKGVHDLNFLWRDMPIFDSFDDPRSKNCIYTAYQRFAQGFGSYRGVDGSTG